MKTRRYIFLAPLLLSMAAAGCLRKPQAAPPAMFVRFDSGKDKPRGDEDTIQIGQAIGTLQREPSLKAAIIGHASADGDPERNKKLSFRRAENVRELLVSNGIAPERLTIAARGSDSPAASNDTEEGRAKNRRVEIFFYDPKRGELRAQYGVQIEIKAR